MKDIKDYLHLYKDCMVQVKRKNDTEYNVGRVCEITSKSNHGDWIVVRFDDVIKVTSQTWETSTSNAHYFFFGDDYIVPILRPLSSMTEEEAIEVARVSEWEGHFRDVKVTKSKFDDLIVSWDGMPESREEFNATGEFFYCAEQFLYLLSKHFDLFNLIEEGLAIDATKAEERSERTSE
jgi:hypothetical protein